MQFVPLSAVNVQRNAMRKNWAISTQYHRAEKQMASDLDRDEAASTLASAQGRELNAPRSPCSDTESWACCPHIAHVHGDMIGKLSQYGSRMLTTYSLSRRLLAELRWGVQFNWLYTSFGNIFTVERSQSANWDQSTRSRHHEISRKLLRLQKEEKTLHTPNFSKPECVSFFSLKLV
jgi:hypothetical protein